MQNGNVFEIFKKEMTTPFDPYRWNKLTISIMDSSMFVVLNRKDLVVDNLIHDAFADPEGGTVGFGSNNIITAFSDIKLSIVMPDAFIVWIQTLKRGSNAKGAAKLEGAKLDAALLEESEGDSSASNAVRETVSAEDILT